ncbi:MAG: rhodanese-like domain-containing protein [Gammaproteobacteria bacterium]|nr:rhodanese-like domain-containing protein [Gammaproteobacteria bacterium]MDH5659390.1 rhodanese-like domain-containing protein [Gammaproteobacteria bacterium]
MDQLITFTSNNTILVVAIIIVSLMLIHSLVGEKLRGYTSISPAESTRMINHDDALILDVRENNEYSDGHIINSLHIPLSTLKTRMSELEKHKTKNIIVACRSGHRSSQACANLKKGGFEHVFNLSGGIMAWGNASLPLVKK